MTSCSFLFDVALFSELKETQPSKLNIHNPRRLDLVRFD